MSYSFSDDVEWRIYERRGELARRHYDRDQAEDKTTPPGQPKLRKRKYRASPAANERRKARYHAERAALLVPQMDGCQGVAPGKTFTPSCPCELCWKGRSEAHLNPDSQPDEAAVHRVLGGEKLHLRPCEKREVVLYATLRGESAAQIADRMGCSDRTVDRHRIRLRAEGRL